MESLFVSVYKFFTARRTTFWIVFIGLFALLSYGASRIRLEEDITKFFPDDERVEKLDYVFRNSKFAERIAVMVSVRDSAVAPSPDSLVAVARNLIPALDSAAFPYINRIIGEVDDSQMLEIISVIQDHLPVFLEDEDYAKLDSLLTPEGIQSSLEQSYHQLISPAGIVSKRIVVKDPLGISYLPMNRLRQLQLAADVSLYDGYLISNDYRHLIFFIESKFKSNDTGNNGLLIDAIDQAIAGQPKSDYVQISYFGGAAVAVGNAKQLQRDTIVTLSIMIVLLVVFLVGYFHRKRIPLLILIPVFFGGLFSLTIVYLIQGSISIIAIAGGSIILGIAINYSLHYFTHLVHTRDIEITLRDLVKPMTIGSATTVLAFLCLQFVNASVLQDLGLFAGFSLVGAAIFTLIFLPHLVEVNGITRKQKYSASRIEKISTFPLESNKPVLWSIVILTPLFFYFANEVKFNTDLSTLNFMNDEMRQSQDRLESINKSSLTSIYAVSQDTNFQKALEKNERTYESLKTLSAFGKIQRFSSISGFLISDSLQKVRLKRWSDYWNEQDRPLIVKEAQHRAQALGFSIAVLSNLDSLLNRQYKPANDFDIFRNGLFGDYIINDNGFNTIISQVNVPQEKKNEVYKQLEQTPSNAFDRLMLTNVFAEYVHADFNFIVTFTSLLVLVALLLTYGRIELTLITFIPMLITWVWILGLMALLGIEFNIVNVMISTFIFGLGDDYSIFTTDGLLTEYSTGKKNLGAIRTSILLSALTTISGLGVLIFAEHPALRSIAGISIIGIICVFLMSQTIQPFLFRWLVTRRVQQGQPPMTFLGLIRTFFLYASFVVGSFLLTIIGLVFKVIPVGRNQIKLFYHQLIRTYTWALVHLDPQVKIHTIGKTQSTFDSPSVIIANHSSFLDILFTAMQHPKVVLLTNKWVWNSPVFGGVVRLADYHPVTEGAEESIDHLRKAVAEGYSIVVFPEGTRTVDGKLKRFHKGAFYLAESLKIPIQPLLIVGAGDAVPKGRFYVNPTDVILKYLPAISPGDPTYGNGYSEHTKTISRYFKDQYHQLILSRSAKHVSKQLVSNYIYKGPVLEWYMRVKIRLENYYQPFHDMVPTDAVVLDLGCGYGFLAYTLGMLSEKRKVTGVDYDEEKIAVAANGYNRPANVNFLVGDITTMDIASYDIIIIADVLHYLLPEAQEHVLRKFFASLKTGAKIIIRDGNADLADRHRGTMLTEFFSVRLLKFNKSGNTLHFISGKKLTELAQEYGLHVEIQDDARLTSNVIFVISKLD